MVNSFNYFLKGVCQLGLHDPIEWRPRTANKLADALCNIAMDRKLIKFCMDREQLAMLVHRGAALQTHSDEGYRPCTTDAQTGNVSDLVYFRLSFKKWPD